MTFLLFQSQGRTEIMSTLEKVIKGLGSAGNSTYKDVYKATKHCMTDRSMVVRFAAAKVSYRLKDGVGGIPYTGDSLYGEFYWTVTNELKTERHREYYLTETSGL